MNQKHINHGPDCDVGILMSRRPRDGTEGNPRDGTDGMPRDGTGRRPRDGTERKPRDGTERRPRDGTERRPRDGTERRPRDGTERMKRDGTSRRPRDGTDRKPRDKTILWEGNLGIRDKDRRTEYPPGAQTQNQPTTKRRNLWGGYVGLMDRHGRGMP